MPPLKCIAAVSLGLTLVSSATSEYCTKEQYEQDRTYRERYRCRHSCQRSKEPPRLDPGS